MRRLGKYRPPAAVTAAIAATMLALGGLASIAVAAPPSTNASTCIECCEGYPVCQTVVQLADLHNTVTELVPAAGLANSLVAKVDAATHSVLDRNFTPALNQLDAFGHEVDALAASGQVAPSVSNILKTKHDTVTNSISNIR